MRQIELLEGRRMFAATADVYLGDGYELYVNLADSNEVSIRIEDGRATVSSDGLLVWDSENFFSGVRVIGNNGGDAISLVSDARVLFDIRGGTGADHVRVEGLEGAAVGGTIFGNNGSDAFTLVNAGASVYGDNGDDVCTFVNSDGSFFGGNGDDACAIVDSTHVTYDGGRGE